MAKLITRTFNGTKVTALVFDKDKNATEEKELYLTGKYDSDEKLEKAVAKYFKDSEYRFVTVLSSVETSELRGMTEEEFLENSVLLDKENRKAI